MLEFWSSTTPTARKDYRCSLCGQMILKGEKYHRYCGKYDGDMFDDKFHLTCRNIISGYFHGTGEREWCEDDIIEWLRDEHCLDCKNYEDGDCEKYPITCPIIREHFVEKGEKE